MPWRWKLPAFSQFGVLDGVHTNVYPMAYNSVFCAAELKKKNKEVDQVSLSVTRKTSK